MYLTKHEEQMLAGERGEAIQLAMEILTRVGDVYGAEKMIAIASAHTVMTYYRIIMDAGVEICEKFAELGARYCVPTTLDPAGMDLKQWQELKIPEDYAERQMRIVRAQEQVGGIPVWTCTPYLHGNIPMPGQDLAWSESSAVVFANSVMGARTNRLTAVVDMAAGIAGRAPKFGLHLDENRQGEILVKINVKPKTLADNDYPAIGYFVGKQVADKIPVLTGVPRNVSTDQLKNMGAAMAASGSVALYHIPGVTPEAKNIDKNFQKRKWDDVLDLDLKELKQTKEEMCTVNSGEVDFVTVGCPHYSIEEIRKLATLLEGKKIHRRTKFWIYTTRHVEMLAKRAGYSSIIETSGAQILTETCMLVSPTDIYGFKTLMTDSGKCAYYGPGLCKTEVLYGSIEECVETAIKGSYNKSKS
ncbi:MAG: aconitase X catalytic domain-containing protein [Candidatus Bathyarchaeota archaeon]|nr:MAG: aconitase X catalytic domain-containing protein [Candidatus Bathyarchaeota archaeon]